MKEYFEALTDSKRTAQFAEIVMMVVCAVISKLVSLNATVSFEDRIRKME